MRILTWIAVVVMSIQAAPPGQPPVDSAGETSSLYYEERPSNDESSAEERTAPAQAAVQVQRPSDSEELRERARRLREKARRLERLVDRLDNRVDEIEDRADDLEDAADDLEDASWLTDEMEELEREIENLERQVEAADRFSRTAAESDNKIAQRAREVGDTVFVLTREGTKEFVSSFAGEGRPSARQRGYGGGIGPVMGVAAINMSPISKLVDRVPLLRDTIGFRIEKEYELFVTQGGMLYGGVGGGVRVGGAGWGASKSLSEQVGDTVYNLDIALGYGGFLFEKAFVLGNANLFLGGMFGGGGMNVDLSADAASVFDLSEKIEDQYQGIGAAFLLAELHGGFTYTFLPWLHLGVDVGVPAFISSNGFRQSSRGITDSFYTVNPTGRLRLLFGNLG